MPQAAPRCTGVWEILDKTSEDGRLLALNRLSVARISVARRYVLEPSAQSERGLIITDMHITQSKCITARRGAFSPFFDKKTFQSAAKTPIAMGRVSPHFPSQNIPPIPERTQSRNTHRDAIPNHILASPSHHSILDLRALSPIQSSIFLFRHFLIPSSS